MQAYNEPVHLGLGDGDPSGGRFYHDYGFDLAGFEGGETVLSCAAGTVVRRSAPGNVAVEDASGLVWEVDHMASIDPGVQLGQAVSPGQPLGILGRTGGSGNFSHLHLGSYLSSAHLGARNHYRRLNLYPWLVWAYEQRRGKGLYAVARPHQLVLTGQPVTFDASRSLAFGRAIASYRWDFHDGTFASGVTAQKVYAQPGVYMAELRVSDAQGNRDVDFCKVKVFTAAAPEPRMPTIFMSSSPTENIRVGQAVSFRCWLQASSAAPLRLDFGDGTVLPSCASYAVQRHAFATPGIHVVTATANLGGLPIAQKLKVRVF
jgi:hypothetical protein